MVDYSFIFYLKSFLKDLFLGRLIIFVWANKGPETIYIYIEFLYIVISNPIEPKEKLQLFCRYFLYLNFELTTDHFSVLPIFDFKINGYISV